ncbi:MAG: hypothetical protein HY720_33075 [Planctomycetes bacterium]|nr:hypothetical protein [Planctomycetota bacterium]
MRSTMTDSRQTRAVPAQLSHRGAILAYVGGLAVLAAAATASAVFVRGPAVATGPIVEFRDGPADWTGGSFRIEYAFSLSQRVTLEGDERLEACGAMLLAAAGLEGHSLNTTREERFDCELVVLEAAEGEPIRFRLAFGDVQDSERPNARELAARSVLAVGRPGERIFSLEDGSPLDRQSLSFLQGHFGKTLRDITIKRPGEKRLSVGETVEVHEGKGRMRILEVRPHGGIECAALEIEATDASDSDETTEKHRTRGTSVGKTTARMLVPIDGSSPCGEVELHLTVASTAVLTMSSGAGELSGAEATFELRLESVVFMACWPAE